MPQPRVIGWMSTALRIRRVDVRDIGQPSQPAPLTDLRGHNQCNRLNAGRLFMSRADKRQARLVAGAFRNSGLQ
jgi:hypothetical protein